MSRSSAATLIGCVLLAVAIGSCGQRHSAAARRWWSHVEALASDSLQGRATGSAGYRRAAEYVAREFEAQGALPGGTDGYFQPVKLISSRIRESESSLALVRDGVAEPLVLGRDAILWANAEPLADLEAPMVFVGYGLSVPEAGHDDLRGLDLEGKVVVYVSGGPSVLPGPLRAHAQSLARRWGRLRAAGAIGTVYLRNPAHADVPWERLVLRRLEPGITLADSSLAATPGRRLAVSMDPARAERLFAGTRHRFSELLALADSGVALPRFPLSCSIRAHLSIDRGAVESPNVVGLVPGVDPRLRDEYVVLSAHLDHLGIGTAVGTDSIFNGAMDNAAGVATLIEVARLAKDSGLELKRSLILLAVTGEEEGLCGSEYFAAHPTVASRAIVADINLDMFLPIVPLRVLTVYGLGESDLGETFRRAAAKHGVRVQDDPEPERNIFIRSDQYSFIRRGVPSLMFNFGSDPGSREQRILQDWIASRYHQPSDDLSQPVNLEGAARFNRLALDLCVAVAERRERPHWNDESFFKRYAAAPALP